MGEQPCDSRSPIRETFEPGSEIARYDFGSSSCGWWGRECAGRTATPIAGNAGALNLTVANPADLLERSDTLLVAKAAALTLRNAPRQDLSQSLTTESVPVAPASEVKFQSTLP